MKKNKIFKLDNAIIDFVENHLSIIIIIMTTLLSLAIRVCLLPYKSQDYIHHLSSWFEFLKNNGGLPGLKNYIGDYNVPYMTIMALLTYFKINSLYLIKAISIVFDYILALSVYKFTMEYFISNKNKKYYAIMGYIAILFLPTLLLNSSYWGQCDVIYTTFIVWSLYYLYKNKMFKSFLFLGLAFSFKLQFIFILPIYIILYFRKKNFSLLYFFLIPLVDIILCIPAMIFNRSVIDCLTVYFKQTTTYSNYLTLNVPNLYTIISGDSYIAKMGILLLICVLVGLFFYIIKNKIKLTNEKILLISILSILLCNFFLPYMHERYMFVADILTILYFICYKRNLFVAITTQLISLCSYSLFLFEKSVLPTYFLTFTFLSLIIYIIYDFVKNND